jgi:hypothetical protein
MRSKKNEKKFERIEKSCVQVRVCLKLNQKF